MTTPRYQVGQALDRLTQLFTRVEINGLTVHCFHPDEDEPSISIMPAAYNSEKASMSFLGAQDIEEVQSAVAYAQALEGLYVTAGGH